jgi:adenosylhomocysteinase
MVKEYWINDIDRAAMGADSIIMSESRMPVLRKLNTRFANEQPLAGITVGACLHVTPETAILVRTLKAGGAKVVLCGSNPLSTQDDVAAALVKDGFNIYAWKGNDAEYYDCLRLTLAHNPDILIDDGADLIVTAHAESKNLVQNMIGSQEETTTGVKRLRIMEQEGALKTPVIAVNDASIKMMFDNRYGTGQGVVSAIKALNVLFAGKTVIVAGYGWCSKGLAMRAKGLGANVVVTEVDPLKALEAVMDGYQVMPMKQAIKNADMIFTSTGCRDVIGKDHFLELKDRALLANLGHFNVEINAQALNDLAIQKKKLKNDVEQFVLPNKRTIYLIAEGRLANLVTLGGHPPEIMDLSFSVQALASELLVKDQNKLANQVIDVPEAVSRDVATIKLETMGIHIDNLTSDQLHYIHSFQIGT